MRKFLHHLFIPRESNNHRAKILHIDSLLIIIALLIFSAALISTVQKNHPQVLGIAYNMNPDDLLLATNIERAKKGLEPLQLDSELSQAAAAKAADMYAKNYWAHIAPDGVTPWSFIKNSGYEYLYAGENLARGFTNAREVVNAWMNSPTHRDNMLSSNYNDVGFAIATGNLTGSDTVLVVEMFGTRFNPQPVSQKTQPNAPPSQIALVLPTNTPTVTPLPVFQTQETLPQERIEVAAIQQQPLIDKNNFTKNFVIGIMALLITVLVIDIIVVERKKIVRAVSHNLDHIIYLIIMLLIIIIMSKGTIL